MSCQYYKLIFSFSRRQWCLLGYIIPFSKLTNFARGKVGHMVIHDCVHIPFVTDVYLTCVECGMNQCSSQLIDARILFALTVSDVAKRTLPTVSLKSLTRHNPAYKPSNQQRRVFTLFWLFSILLDRARGSRAELKPIFFKSFIKSCPILLAGWWFTWQSCGSNYDR